MSNTHNVSAPSHAHLRFAIFEYLSSLIKSGNMKEEQTESLEVAVQCMSEAFGFSTEEPSGNQHELSLKPLTLPVIFRCRSSGAFRLCHAWTQLPGEVNNCCCRWRAAIGCSGGRRIFPDFRGPS